ncbi:MAG TPA: response regulator [Acidimicrobiales bacterium]|nr:response regulator [Acidimicrobiales bacterium]
MIRVLVVDDDFRVASLHAAYVEKVPGFVVVGQAHSAQALVANLEPLAPDLVLLDLYLPDQHGLEVLKRLRQARSAAGNVDVIVITAASDAASVRSAMQYGAFHYLLKPFGFAALQERLLAYQAMHRQLGSLQQADQTSVDRLYSSMSATAKPEPKSHTLEAVEDLLAEVESWLTASEVAAKLGTSRATAQRYLNRLEASGRVVMSLRYGTTGRPEHRYRHQATGTQWPGEALK